MLSRRQFVSRTSALGAAAVFAPQALLSEAKGRGAARTALRGGLFAQGVLSGDPSPTGITLWTALNNVAPTGSVVLEVAKDQNFNKVVARKRLATGAAVGNTVKARIEKLSPHERYFYRFETKDKASPVGRFQTALPGGSKEPVRFAFFSCAEYAHGFYNAYDLMAREDIDFIVCLGDYIYAETYSSGNFAVRTDDIGSEAHSTKFAREAITLDDYRAKYALYRSDPALRKLHSKFPMITVWDDHEVQDNYSGRPKNGGLPASHRYSPQRKAAAYKAFFEHMPLLPQGDHHRGTRIYRALPFGNTVDLIMLDERQYRDDQPCNDSGKDCAERQRPRNLLGPKQMAFLKQKLETSTAAWKIIGNTTPIMPAKVGPTSYNLFDAWQGYLTEREELLAHIRDRKIQDVAFITGDFHTFFAGDVRPGESSDPATTVATEFVAGSITSSGPGEAGIPLGGGLSVPGNDRNPSTPQAIVSTLMGYNPWIDGSDLDHHGYGLVEATQDSLDVRFRRVKTIKKPLVTAIPDQRWTVARGKPSIKGKRVA